MRAAVVQGQGLPLSVEDLPDPTPGPGEVVLRVEACGICGSDLHMSAMFPMPGLVMGHELCGEVVATGAGVEGVREGQRVVSLSLATCGRCGPCLTGRPRRCAQARMLGIEIPGGYAELVVMPAHDVIALPDALDARHGALVEPLAVALHTVDRCDLRPGEPAVVVGAGPVGLAVTAWLRHLGAGEVIVSDPVAARRDLAGSVGASAVIDPAGEDVAEAAARLAGGAPSLVVECVGVPGMIQHATEVVAEDGRVVVVGVCMQPDHISPLVPMQKELDVRFAFYYRAADYAATIRAIDRGRFDPLPLVTDEIGLDDLPARFEALRSPNTEAKVLIRPDGAAR